MNGQVKLLLVDSNPPSLSTFSKPLKDAGYHVLTTDSVDEGLNLSNSEKPDLVILDLNLPNLAGIDLASEFLDAGIPFIFLCNPENGILDGLSPDPGTHGVLERSLKNVNVLPAIESAVKWAEETRRLRETETRYSHAIETGRVVDVVVGILMERHHLERERAFELLRNKARSERKKLRDLAQEILDALNKINQLTQ
ncbi:MAG: ANTAR domain-containing protein [Candidatus Thiodiazotropha sp. (ex Monitilora ramsayi)]|nr:ANTAR domain-containing protein [Candidatus Thiodiazotropha sp. (ex Monitilora ramsayi)]